MHRLIQSFTCDLQLKSLVFPNICPWRSSLVNLKISQRTRASVNFTELMSLLSPFMKIYFLRIEAEETIS